MAMEVSALLASAACSLANVSRATPMGFPLGGVPKLYNHCGLRVKCVAEEGALGKANIPLTSKSNRTQSQKQRSTSFTELFAFSGPGPERINGRLAMIGFVAALGTELLKGTDLFDQISHGGGLWFLLTMFLLHTASLVPLLRGENPEEGTDGFMNSKAEIWNGRLAMLGLIALAATEYFKGGALV